MQSMDDTPDGDGLDPDELVRQVIARFRTPRYLAPMLPVVAVEMMTLSQHSDSKLSDMACVVHRDPLLAAAVLRRAQSASHAGVGDVRSLDEAIGRVGHEVLRGMVFELSLNTRIFQAFGYTQAMERLRIHSVATAEAARIVCRQLDRPLGLSPMIGLLHDVGIAGLFIVLSERPTPPPLEATWPLVHRMHAETSGALARLWRLPRQVIKVLAHHHDVVIDGRPDTLAAVQVVSERFAFEMAPLVGDDPSTPQRPRLMPGKDISDQAAVKQACAMLGIDGRRWVAIRDEAQVKLADVR